MTADPQTDFDGCYRKCRVEQRHTMEYGGCEYADKPEPTVSMSKVYTDPEDGYPSIGFDTYTVDQLAELLDPVLGFEAMRAREGSVDLSHLAAHTIVHRNDPAAPAAARVVSAAPDQANLRQRIAQAIDRVTGGTCPGDILDAVLSVLPPPADRAAILREAISAAEDEARHLYDDMGQKAAAGARLVADRLRRMADETQPTTEPEPGCTHCGKTIRRITGTLTEWWVHIPGGRALCYPWQPAKSPSATPKPAAEVQQDDTWPVKEDTRRYAAELRSNPGTVVADGHTGWECDAGASLIVEASTPGPGKLGTHHGVIYACAGHRAAAVERITGAGYEVDPRSAPPGHRWNPWPCGHVTAHDSAALAALAVVDGPTAGARQDGAQQ